MVWSELPELTRLLVRVGITGGALFVLGMYLNILGIVILGFLEDREVADDPGDVNPCPPHP